MGAAKDVSVVHHQGDKALFSGSGRRVAEILQPCAKENALTGVDIVHPLVEDEDPSKIANVAHGAQQGIREVVIDNEPAGIDGHAGAEVDAGDDRFGAVAGGDSGFGVGGKKPLTEVDHRDFRRRDPEVVEQDA